MSTRKIKNAKDVTTDELIYFKSHAQATFMSDGTTVEDAINNLQQGTDVNNVYVTDFTIQDLVDLRNTQDVEFIFVDKSSLSTALAEQKLILVRESSDETVKGYHILTGYEDDLMYLTIHDYGSNSYYIETAHSQDNDSFYKNEVGQVIVQERLVTGNNIKSVCGESLVDGVGDITPSFLSVGSTNPHILNLPFGFQNGRYFCKDLESNVRTLVCNLSSDYYYGYISVAREYHPPVLLSLRDIANTETAIASQTFTIYYDSTSHNVYVTAGMSGKVHIRSCSGITKLPKDWYATFIDLTTNAGQEEFRRFLNNNNYDNLLGVTVRLSNDNAETVVFTITNVSGDGINDVMLSGAGPAYSVQTNIFDYTDFSTLTFTKTPFSSGGNTGASAPAFGTCVDTVAVVDKTVQVSGDFPTQLVDNTRVSVLFQYANLAANPTMNVNGTGAYPIMWKNANTASWIANQIYDFVYYNECWYLLGGVDTDTNTDTKVTTSVTTTNNTFPLLFTYTANKANNIAEAARFATDLKYNPSTKELTHGGLSFKDGNGNTIGLPTITESTILVVENNLKTINGQSIIGNGDITISGGGSSSGSGAYTEVNHGTSDTTFTLTPNTFHVWDGVSTLTLTLGSETSGVANEFLFQFTSGSESTSLILPDDIKWTNDEAPVIEANKIYQISILKGLGSVMSWGNIQLINFTIIDIEYQAEEGMTWNDWAESKYNSIGFLTSDTYICHPNGYGCVSYMNNLVNISDIILPASYVLYQGSGGGA